MYKVIVNESSLIQWEQESKGVIPLWDNVVVVRELQKNVQRLDYYYGTQRNIEQDLGGYIIVYWGTRQEVEWEKYCTLQYHHLQEREYEYEDSYIQPDGTTVVTVRLYLCSSDYSVLQVLIY